MRGYGVCYQGDPTGPNRRNQITRRCRRRDRVRGRCAGKAACRAERWVPYQDLSKKHTQIFRM